MHRLIEFIKRIYIVLLFLVIEAVAIWCYATATPYTESKLLARTTAIGGTISGTVNYVKNFVSLPDQNEALTARVAALEEELERRNAIIDSLTPDMDDCPFLDSVDVKFRYHPARVTSITTNRQHNYIVLNRGIRNGIAKNMGVITPNKELVGTVVSCSESYAVVMPLLNTRFKIGGRVVENDYVCSIYWEGDSQYEVTAVELSKYANPKAGMSVNVESDRMPRDIKIGTIESYELNNTKSAYSVVLNIAADMQSLSNLLVVENMHQAELDALIEPLNN